MNIGPSRFLIAAALTLVLAIAFVFGFGEILSRPVRRVIGPAPQDLGAVPLTLNYQSIRDDEVVKGWLVRTVGSKGVVLLLHGVRGDRRQMEARARFLKTAGYSSLLIDLPSHGESSGERITFGARESLGVDEALAYICTTFPGQPVGVIGISLGAAAFLLSKKECAPKAVVVESVYPTIEEATVDRLRKYLGPLGPPFAWLLLFQIPLRTKIGLEELRPIEHVKDAGAPILVVSGSADQDTTAQETRRIFEDARQPKELWIVEGAGHVDLHRFAQREYEARIGAFLEHYMR
jgi:fermentation-respiration switch protein FrsA (DUF1100 family)